MILMASVMPVLNGVLQVFPQEKAVFLREYTSNWCVYEVSQVMLLLLSCLIVSNFPFCSYGVLPLSAAPFPIFLQIYRSFIVFVLSLASQFLQCAVSSFCIYFVNVTNVNVFMVLLLSRVTSDLPRYSCSSQPLSFLLKSLFELFLLLLPYVLSVCPCDSQVASSVV